MKPLGDVLSQAFLDSSGPHASIMSPKYVPHVVFMKDVITFLMKVILGKGLFFSDLDIKRAAALREISFKNKNFFYTSYLSHLFHTQLTPLIFSSAKRPCMCVMC